MDFSVDHDFPVPAVRVKDAMCAPDLADHLHIPDVQPPELVGRVVDGDAVTMRLHFVYTGQLDPIASRVLSGQLAWVQEWTIRPDAEVAPFRIVPDRYAERLRCAGEFRFRDTDAGSVRTTSGRLDVKVPLIGGKAASALLPAILRRLDGEAASLRERLTTG